MLLVAGTEVGMMGMVVVEDEELVPWLGTVGGIIGMATRVVGTAVGMIPTGAVVDGSGDAFTGTSVEVLEDAPSEIGVAVTTLSERLRSAGTAVGIIGTKGADEEVVVEVVTVFVTVTVSTFSRRCGLSGEERVEEMREVKKKERIVRVCMIGDLEDKLIFSGMRRCSDCRSE